ncbi:MAG: phosphatase PAP2 family protein [Rhodoferax sp.]|nr:phosphatase PAP2 family protein [Rhodoferax sp.]
MLPEHALHAMPYWHFITRLGEAEILLPAALLTAGALLARPHTRRLALGWMALLALAATLTTASKLAFIGWGLGSAAMNFTGVAGHAMFASAIYPVLMLTFVPGASRSRWHFALGLGLALALLVAISRLAVGAHSLSEVLAGLLVGGSVTAATLAWYPSTGLAMRPIVPALLLAWVAVTPFQLQASQTHSLVTRLALAMSGHEAPYTRAELLRHRQST